MGLWQESSPLDEIASLRRLSEQRPGDAVLLENLADAYHRAGQLLPALHAYDRVIELGAATDRTWCKTGNSLTDAGEYAQAMGAYERSLQLNGAFPEAHHNLARVVYRLGDVDRAARHLEIATRQCDALDPWLSLAVLIPGAPSATQERILHVRRQFAAKLREVQRPTPRKPPRGRRGSAKNTIRVGYLSAFFHSPNYMKPVWGLINEHDRSRFEIHLLSDSPTQRSVPGYVEDARDRIHDIRKLTNEDLVELVRALRIDLLVDLNGYSHTERLAVFLDPPAPATIAWFNLYATSALPGIDYLVGDASVVTADEEPHFTENVWRLPQSYLSFAVLHATPPVVEPPCVRNGFFTYGSLVAQYKITPPVLDVWAEILEKTPGSKLLLANTALKSVHNRAHVRAQFAERGVDEDRVILEGPADHLAYLGKYDRIDLALDAFPYNGGTTTMEAVWQGVPVQTWLGDRWASRTSASLLWDTHLRGFVAADLHGYIAGAVELARDPATPARLSELRSLMRDRLRNAPVCDTRSLARSMERIYKLTMTHCGRSTRFF